MKWRKRRYFEILAPRSSLRHRVAYSLAIVRLILVPVIFLAVYHLFEMGWIVDRMVNIDAPAPRMAEQASIQMLEARRAERTYFCFTTREAFESTRKPSRMLSRSSARSPTSSQGKNL